MDSFRWDVEKRSGKRGYTIELRFEEERLRIAYRGRDVGDGLGPRDEELELVPDDIVGVHWKQRKHLLVVVHTVHGPRSTRSVEEELPVGDDPDRAILLLDRFQRYLRRFNIDGSSEHNDRALARLADSHGYTVGSPPADMSSADELLQASTDLKRHLSPEERDRALAAGRPYIDGMADMVELPCDEGRRKVLRRPQRRRQIAEWVLIVVSVLAAVLLSALFGAVFFVVMMIALAVVIMFAFDSFKPDSALWNQSVRIGPDRLMFHRWRGNWNDDVYFTDVSRTPFCVRLIDSYRVDEEEIVVYGNFWNDHQEEPNDTGSDSCTRRVPGFKIARAFSDEDEAALLACLDRLKRV